MLKLAASILVVFGMTSAFAAENARRAAESAECKVITARLMEATNAEVDHYSLSGDDVVLKAPKIVLSCANHRPTGISMGGMRVAFLLTSGLDFWRRREKP